MTDRPSHAPAEDTRLPDSAFRPLGVFLALGAGVYWYSRRQAP
jgi:hypothetical protein